MVWLLRAKHNRTLKGGNKLWARSTSGLALSEWRFSLAQRQGHQAREVIQPVWAQLLPESAKGQVEVASLPRQAEPPEGQKPIAWCLLTQLPVSTLQGAARTIEGYWARWQIERLTRAI